MNTTLWGLELRALLVGVAIGAVVQFVAMWWARPRPTHCAACRVSIAAEKRMRRP